MPKLGTSTDTYRCITIKVKRIRENGILGSKWSIYMTLPLSKLRNHRGRGGRNTVKSRDGNRRLKCVPVTKEQLHMGTTNRYNNIHKTHTNSSQRGEGRSAWCPSPPCAIIVSCQQLGGDRFHWWCGPWEVGLLPMDFNRPKSWWTAQIRLEIFF